MAQKALSIEAVTDLLDGKRTTSPKRPRAVKDPPAQFVTEIRPDPLHKPQVGYEQPGDKGDIWAQWVKQRRQGAAELIERWG